MKKLLFAFMALMLFACSSDDSTPATTPPVEENPTPGNPTPVQCRNVYTGDLVLTTQEEVDMYAGYCKIDGDLYIITYETDITDLSPLYALEEVNGMLRIDGTTIESLHGLENLKTVYGLTISYNDNLTSLDKLSSFMGISPENQYGGEVNIFSNRALVNLKGLEHLTTVNMLRIWNCGLMVDLSGLEGLTTFPTPSVDAFFRAPEFEIDLMPGLTSLNGLQNITDFTNGNLKITSCRALSNYCAIQSLATQNNFDLECGSNQYNPTLQDIIAGNCSQ